MEVNDRGLQQIFENRIVKNGLQIKYKVSRQEYNRDRRRVFKSGSGFKQQQCSHKPEIFSLLTSTIREELQRVVKLYKNSLAAIESLNNNQRSVRLKPSDLKVRLHELPMKIEALENLRDLWRSLQNYACDLNLNERMAYLMENEQKNIIQTLCAVIPCDQPHIDLFILCFKTPECIEKWRQLIGDPEKWKAFFT